MRSFLADTRPLRNTHFRRLWTANIVTVIGAQLTVVAVPAQIYTLTGSSAYVGLTGVFGLVPLVVFGLWGGALADVIDRRTLLVATTVGLIATSALFWLQAWSGVANVWALLGLFSVQQAFFAVNQPTRSAVLPRTTMPIDLAVDGGRFAAVDGQEARETINLGGRLVTPPLWEPHIHWCCAVGRCRPAPSRPGRR